MASMQPVQGSSNPLSMVKPAGWFGLLIALIVGNPIADAKVYRWVDENGTVHYGDSPPPTGSKSAHTELNERGITVREVHAPKTPEEKREEERLAQEKERQILEKQQRGRHDKALLDMFTTEKDLVRASDTRLKQIDNTIRLSRISIERWRAKLEPIQSTISQYAEGAEIPPRLQDEHDKLQHNIDITEAQLLKSIEDRSRTAQQFARDLERFRELKSGAASP